MKFVLSKRARRHIEKIVASSSRGPIITSTTGTCRNETSSRSWPYGVRPEREARSSSRLPVMVRCPERDDGFLAVQDDALPGARRIERYLVCEVCGARNVIRMGAARE